jgi:hypothetical protein
MVEAIPYESDNSRGGLVREKSVRAVRVRDSEDQRGRIGGSMGGEGPVACIPPSAISHQKSLLSLCTRSLTVFGASNVVAISAFIIHLHNTAQCMLCL